MVNIIRYNGQNVYTHSANRVTRKHLEKSSEQPGRILDAYFFQLGPDRTVERVDFERKKVQRNKIGLLVDVGRGTRFSGQASVAIAGLDRITRFLYDTQSLGDLSTLKDRTIKQYYSGIELLGIGIR